MITFIRDGIGFHYNGSCQREDLELQSVCVKQSKNKWLTIHNMYIPPKSEFDLSWIPVKKNSICAGDLNGHSRLWDDIQPEDDEGLRIVNWMLENNLVCMNDGSPTRINRGTLGLSTPDVTMVSQQMSTKVKWSMIDESSMGSDHSLIIIEISDGYV